MENAHLGFQILPLLPFPRAPEVPSREELLEDFVLCEEASYWRDGAVRGEGCLLPQAEDEQRERLYRLELSQDWFHVRGLH